MKKKYELFALKMVMVVLGIFIISSAVLTYEKALQIKNEYMKICYEKTDFITELRLDLSEDSSTEKVVKSVYESLEDAYISDENIGFFSELKNSEGSSVAYSQNYLIVGKENDETRIVLMGNSFPSDTRNPNVTVSFAINNIDKINFEGECDSIFIYPTKMTWTTGTLEKHEFEFPGTERPEETDTISYEEWKGDDDIYVTVNYMGTLYGDAAKKDKINQEAKEICEKIYNDFFGGDTLDDQTSEGIFTTYVAGTGYINKKMVMPYVYVFHPIAIAMSELAGVYIIMTFIFIIMVIIICQMIRKMYIQQNEFDLRTREMTRGVAHELKTPLAITKSYVENWQYIDEEDREDYCRNMVDEIDHMNLLVNDLLELARMESGVKQLQKEEVDLMGLTKMIYAHMKGLLEERNLEMDITTDGTLEEYLVNADLEMMRIVITNFMSNAVKYADKKITVSLTHIGKKIVFHIENDGPGILKEDFCSF